jgi:ribosomal protein S18 acetylase RimI-like enzyme
MEIVRLVPADARRYQELRLLALRESPTAFSYSYDEECETPMEEIAEFLATEPGRAVFGAVIDDRLVGMVVVGRESRPRLSHKGYIRSMYVAPTLRGKGVGKRLLSEALAFAATMKGVRQLMLVVTADNPAAVALYESMGFESFGVEPAAFQVGGVLYDDIQMVRYIDRS